MRMDVAGKLDQLFPSVGGWALKQSYGGKSQGTSQGAELWRSTSGELVIVKRHSRATVGRFEAVCRRVEVLRRAGVPAPITRLATEGSEVLLVHEYLPGRSDPLLTASLVADLIAIIERESGLADDSAKQWPDVIRTTLTVGADTVEHDSLQRFSEESRRLLRRIRNVGTDSSLDGLSAPDLVHFDLHTVNVISDDGRRVSGVIDWDGVRAGHRSLDFAKVAFTSLWKTSDVALHEQLWNAFLGSSTHDARVIYMHHVALGQVDWVIRHPGLAPGPERTMQLATWALDVTETGAFFPPP